MRRESLYEVPFVCGQQCVAIHARILPGPTRRSLFSLVIPQREAAVGGLKVGLEPGDSFGGDGDFAQAYATEDHEGCCQKEPASAASSQATGRGA